MKKIKLQSLKTDLFKRSNLSLGQMMATYGGTSTTDNSETNTTTDVNSGDTESVKEKLIQQKLQREYGIMMCVPIIPKL